MASHSNRTLVTQARTLARRILTNEIKVEQGPLLQGMRALPVAGYFECVPSSNNILRESDTSTVPSNPSTTSFPVSPMDSPPVTFVIEPNKVPLAVARVSLTFGLLAIATAILGCGIYCPTIEDEGCALIRSTHVPTGCPIHRPEHDEGWICPPAVIKN